MDIRAIIMGVGFAVMWSSAFTTARIIVTAAPPLTALSIRFLISGVLGILIALALKQSFRLTRAQWRATLVFGICQNALYLGLYFVAMQTVEASLAAIIASTMPLAVALMGWVVFGERIGLQGTLGLAAGMVGVALIMGTRISGGADLYGVALCVLGMIALSFATLAVRGASSGGNYLMVVGLQMLIGAVALGAAALALETVEVAWSWTLFWAFAYTTLVPGLAATVVWFRLVHRIGATRAASFHLLNPFLGVGIAAVLLGEALRTSDIIGVVIITVGIMAVQISKRREKPGQPIVPRGPSPT